MGRPRGLVEGVGYHSDKRPTSENGKHTFEYRTWANMLKRCYNKASLDQRVTYLDKEVCEMWLDYCKFYDWFQGVKFYRQGWQLDKDLLIKGNRVYGPDTCLFLPPAINGVLLKCDKSRGELPLGVHYDKDRMKYKATCCNENGKQWQKRFNSVEEAFASYKQEKERVMRALALRYRDEIDPRAYDALMNYTVEITD